MLYLLFSFSTHTKLSFRFAGWTYKWRSLISAMLNFFQTKWIWWLIQSSLNISWSHGHWTSKTLVMCIKQQHANSCKNFRYTLKRAKDGDSVQATAYEWAADHLPPLLPPAADVLCYFILQTHLLWSCCHCQPVNLVGNYHTVHKVGIEKWL